MGPIASFSGLASGIQWRDMIEQIIKLESNRRLTPVTSLIRARQAERTEWSRYRDLLTAFGAAAKKLKDGSALSPMTTTVGKSPTSSKELLSAQASSTAQPGVYQVEVAQLAAAHKVRGGTIADASVQLGLTGEFHLNGKRVEVVATDTLQAIRDKINLAGAGVSATILSSDASDHRLVLTAQNTGSRGVELVDGTAGVLEGLGIVTSTRSANLSSDGTAAQTQRFGSASTSVGALLGGSMPAATTIVVNGKEIAVDLSVDSLTALRDRIVAAGESAALTTETVAGVASTRLSVTGTVEVDNKAADPAASQRVLDLLGFQRKSFAAEVVAGADAKLNVDGVAVVRRENTVTGVVEGLTLNLLVAEPGTTVEVSIARDQAAAVKEVEAFAKAYNDITSFVKGQRDRKGPLYASGALRSMMYTLRGEMTSQITGLSASNPYDRATLVGITFDRSGVLNVDGAKLKDVLSSDFANVDEMLRGLGTGLESLVTPITDPLDGDIARQLESLDLSVKSLEGRETVIRASLDRQRESMAEQFARMEKMLSRVQSQSGWLLSQLQNSSGK